MPKQTRITALNARAGESTAHLRYILAISLVLAIVAMSAAWIIPALWG